MDITQMDLLLRALASPSRIDLLHILFTAPPDPPSDAPGTTPTELAAHLEISRSAVSHHLKVLLRMRLVRYWKKGVHKFYTPSRPRAGSERERLLTGLAEALRSSTIPSPPKSARPAAHPGRPARHRDVAKSPTAEVWSALTAFSNFRRILMVKALMQRGRASQADLMRAADLDRKTVKYHVSKLVRRGVLGEGEGGLTVCKRLPTPLHAVVLALISIPGG